MTLLEVVLSLAIFLFSITAISQLLSLSTQAVVEGNQRSQAGMMCQSKLAEVLAGVLPFSGTGYAPFEEDADWEWMMDCTQDTANPLSATGLWDVEIHVRKTDRPSTEVSLRQMIFDTSLKGSTLDAPPSSASPSGGM